MIADLKPYPEYEESGLPWLGRCPKNWSLRRTKILFQERVQKGFPNEPLLAATQTKGVVKKVDYETRTVTAQKDLHLLKLVEVGDYVISLRSFQGGIEVAHCRGIISPAYTVLMPRKPASTGYYSHFFKAKPFIDSLSLFVTGIREGQNIDYERLSRAEMPLPPADEQSAIVRFLDWANGRLEWAIRAKRKVIALLNEQKQAIIHRVVTRGLDPSVPFKRSGIPWLGDIPQHWGVMALGRLCIARCDGPFGSGLKSMHYTDSGVRVIRLQNIGNGEFRDRGGAFISEKHYATLGDHGVREGDLLVAGLGDEKIPAGRACIAPPMLGPAMVKADCFRFRLRAGRVIPAFLAKHLSATATAATACLSTGATRLRINLSATAARSIVLPPAEEQQNILDIIGNACAPIDTTISRLQREIELLREYRTRLVADVVTGKLDVRETATRLPNEVAPDSAEGDTDLSLDPEAADEEASV